jgi:phospholipid/cholesterol/gamma-HCH transport system permease protein
MITRIGHRGINIVISLANIIEIIFVAFKSLPSPLHPGRRPITGIFLKQVYFTGLESLNIILIISLSIGTVIVTQVISLVGATNETMIGKILVWVVIRELGPLLAAIIVIARSGTAIATEIGFMKINREIESIESLGIPSEQYLIMPRIFGATTAVIILTIYFELFSIVGGFLIASFGWHVPFEDFYRGIFSTLSLRELAISITKSFFFGLFLSASCCKQGLAVGKSATQIPQAATKGVMQSLFLVFILDGIITVASLTLRSG